MSVDMAHHRSMGDTAATGSSTFGLGRPVQPLNLKSQTIRSSINTEEDDSSFSTSSTDVSGACKGNLDVVWRHGSSESATSTGVTSICSSIATDENLIAAPTKSMSFKKRMADGTFKLSAAITTTSSSKDSLQSLIKSPSLKREISPQVTNPYTSTTPPRKRRGRPPNDGSGIATVFPRARRASSISRLQDVVRPRSSIPARVRVDLFASQCIEAAHAARLSPYALHPQEHLLLVNQLMNQEVTTYLNIRNAILRVWHQNPLCIVTVEEAAGCAKDGRFFGLAEVAYKWLVRNGYINFGCVEVPQDNVRNVKAKKSGVKPKTIVVIGAGVSGLTTARQLEGLFAQNSGHWTEAGEHPPKVVILEGRKRIGGRVFSKPLRSQVAGSLPNGLRNTAEMGAMIVTGFEHGNPLDSVIRGQLGIRYHLMTDALTIYDTDGEPVDEHQDMLNTELYTDISDRAGEYRAIPNRSDTLRGDEELVRRCRDPISHGFDSFQLEPLFDPLDGQKQKVQYRRGRRRNAPPGTEKLTGRSRVIEESGATQSAARAAKAMGWQLNDGIARSQSISLHKIARSSRHPTLGSVMDEAIEQYQDLIDIAPQDMRLLNWHHANLEYANAAPVSSLSLSGHDQDTGNEFEGAHSEIIGGYTQLPRGLMNLPTKLDVRFDSAVESVHYDHSRESEGKLITKVVCTNGEVFEADEVVVTAPLGVLKAKTIDFDPPLPQWKQSAISRMGFGLLNKVILLYEKPFWDESRDMFGLLNEPEEHDSLETVEYARQRGRFYLIWNATKTSGRPMLVALMAGHAAHDVETTSSSDLLDEINSRLRSIFPDQEVPRPLEVIVTRWKKDPFTRGTYSYVGPETKPGDYDLMAKPIGNLHFAGEATCGTHPATVHGAFLSGLRVAAEVMQSLVGPITLPNPLVKSAFKQGPMSLSPIKISQPRHQQYAPIHIPLVADKQIDADTSDTLEVHQPLIKQEREFVQNMSVPTTHPTASQQKPSVHPRQSVCAGDPSFWARSQTDSSDFNYEAMMLATVISRIGERPAKPSRPGVNPFLVYTKSHWDECKDHCSKDAAGAGRDVIRQTLGKWWKALSDVEKAPYLVQSQTAQEQADQIRRDWEEQSAKWDAESRHIREAYRREHPPPRNSASAELGHAIGVSKRKTNTSNCVVLDHA
nr:lysine-specific histone demethylase 1a [Quercus suber]